MQFLDFFQRMKTSLVNKLFMKFSNIIFIANNVTKPYATLFALVNFFQRMKTSLFNKLFKKLSQIFLKQNVPYATLFALAKLFTKNQDQSCVQVVNETFQHYFKANNALKPYATFFALVDFIDLDKLFMKFLL